MIYLMVLVTLLFTNFLFFINLTLMKNKFKNKMKMSPYECGFDPLSDSRLPFSLQFYLIGIIFLIFDVEISMILPMIKCFKITNFLTLTNMMTYIMTMLILGLMMELKEGTLKWFK